MASRSSSPPPRAPRGGGRTSDVDVAAPSFGDLGVPPFLVAGLTGAGFGAPSPVQVRLCVGDRRERGRGERERAFPQPHAFLLVLHLPTFQPTQALSIPLALAGADLLVRARAGTGKTAAFAVPALAAVDVSRANVQSLILAPTRELALQAADVLSALASAAPPPGISVAAFVGGLPSRDDAARLKHAVHVVCATPGRCAALATRARGCSANASSSTPPLDLTSIRCVVLDEADALLTHPLAADTRAVLAACGGGGGGEGRGRLQTLAFSATLGGAAAAAASALMLNPVTLDANPGQGASLEGVTHFWADGGDGSADARARAAVAALSVLPFCQAAAFCATRAGAAALATSLSKAGFPPALLTGALPQVARCGAVAAMRAFRARVAVATDVGARGVDLDRVTAVLNVDGHPADADTLAHRAGRAGRFGGRGVCVTLCCGEGERRALNDALSTLGAPPAAPLPVDGVPPAACAAPLATEDEVGAHAGMVRLRGAVVVGGGDDDDAPPSAAASTPPLKTTYTRDQLLALQPVEPPPPPTSLPPAVAAAPATPSPGAPPPPRQHQRARSPPPAWRSPVARATLVSGDDGDADLDDAALEAAIRAVHVAAAEAAAESEEEAGESREEPAPHPPPAAWVPPPPPPPQRAPAPATPSPPCTGCGARRLDSAPLACGHSPNDPLISVPLSLVRRYYELEWDAWAGRHAVWREAAAWAAWSEGKG